MPADLGDKLRRFNAAGRSAPARPPPRPAGIESVVAGRFEPTTYGECFVVEQRFALSWRQGAFPLSTALALSPLARELLGRADCDEALEPRRALFLDTETTGLSGGTGTYAFMVGLGHVDGDDFLLRQYFMRHPGEEAALLAALEDILAAFPIWITFNGKAFDAPLLDTRFRYTRRRPGPAPRLHVDLLHPARRLWRNHLPSCALGTLERTLLGVRRQDDVPSWMIPTLYFDYVRRGQCEPLRDVFTHNTHDLLSLAALLGLVGQVLHEPHRYAERVDLVAVLRMYAQARRAEEAADWCQAALAALPASARGPVAWELAALLRRLGRRERAAELWRELARNGGPWSVAAQVELAKHLEHGERDYRAAARAVEAALAALAVSRLPAAEVERAQLERRLGRLRYRARLEQDLARVDGPITQTSRRSRPRPHATDRTLDGGSPSLRGIGG